MASESLMQVFLEPRSTPTWVRKGSKPDPVVLLGERARELGLEGPQEPDPEGPGEGAQMLC